MSVLDRFKNLIKEPFGGFMSDNNSLEEKMPVFPEWFFTARIGQPRKINVNEVRQFARSPWVQMVLSTIKRELSIIDLEIVNTDSDDDTVYEKETQIVEDFLKDMNSEHETVDDLMSQMVTDIGEIDAGTLIKVFSRDSYDLKQAPILDDLGRIKGTEEKLVLKPFGQRKLVEVRPADASTILKQIDVYRRLQAYYQYSFKNPRTNPIRFEPEEVIYFLMNKKSYSLYGFSPVQSVQQVLSVLINSTRWNKDIYKNALPPLLVGLPGANPKELEKFVKRWKTKIKTNPQATAFYNTDLTVEKLNMNSKDMEWLDGQRWYFHLIFAAFGVSPAEAGFHEDVNRSAQEGQERVTVKNAIKPYLVNFENKINREIITELLQNDKPPIKVRYNPTDHNQEQIEFTQDMQKVDRGIITVNEYRKYQGMETVDWGDEPLTRPMPEQQEEPEKEEKHFTKSFETFMARG